VPFESRWLLVPLLGVHGFAARNGTPISFWQFARYGAVVASLITTHHGLEARATTTVLASNFSALRPSRARCPQWMNWLG
jgi:hypothetical protein